VHGTHPQFAFDCATSMPPATCAVSNAVAQCIDGRMCDPTTPPACAGAIAVACGSDGTESQVSCDWLFPGSRCESGVCAGSGVSCNGAVACNSDVGGYCSTRTGRAITFDCAAVFAGHCHDGSSGSIGGCVPDATECVFGERQCASGLLQVCVNGRFHALDCTRLGFRTCGATALGPDCVP
jgi:hypothetical protein